MFLTFRNSNLELTTAAYHTKLSGKTNLETPRKWLTQISHSVLLQSQVTPDSSANTYYYSPGTREGFPVELIAAISVHYQKKACGQ